MRSKQRFLAEIALGAKVMRLTSVTPETLVKASLYEANC